MLRYLALLAVAGCGLTVVGLGEAPADGGAPDGGDAPVTTATSAPTATPPGQPDADVPDVVTGCGTCSTTAVCEGTTCVDVAGALVAFRYELACVGPGSNSQTCAEPTTVPKKTVTLGGTTGRSYDVHIHVRGEVEQRAYPGAVSANATGTNASFFVTATVSGSDAWNAYPLVLSDPATTYCLNAGTSGHYYVDALDYTATIRVKAGATLSMQSQASDTNIIKNIDQADGTPVVVPGVPPAPASFNGQFLQIDVDGVAPVVGP